MNGMIKKIGVFALGACVLVVSGCGTLNNITTDQELVTIEKDVQAEAVKICGFLPDAASIAQILGAGDAALTIPIDIANAICSAFPTTTPASAQFGASLKYPATLSPTGLPVLYPNGKPLIVNGSRV